MAAPTTEQLKAFESFQKALERSDETLDSIITKMDSDLVDAVKNLTAEQQVELQKIQTKNALLGKTIKHFEAVNIAGGKLLGTITSLSKTTSPFLFLIEQAAERFSELDKAGEQFRTETGLLASQTGEIENNIRSASRDMAEFGVDVTKAMNAAKALTTTFGDQFMASNKANVEYIALMKENLGVAEEDSAKVLSNFMGMNKMSSETARYMTAQAASLAKAAGVPFAKVMKEVANASGETLAAIKGSVPQLIKAAVTAELLGTDLNKVGAAAGKLLDFQSSIADEMEASLLMGRDLNLQKARELAYAGDLDGLAKEQARLLNEMGDLSKMDYFQKQAAAKALGMSVEEMTKMNAKQQELAELQRQNPELAKQYNDELQKMNDLNKANEKDLSKKYAQELKSKQIQAEQTKLANQFKELLVNIQDVLVPIVKLLMGVANVFVLILKPVTWMFKFIGWIVDEVEKLVVKGVQWANGFETVKSITTGISSVMKDISGYIEKYNEELKLGVGFITTALLLLPKTRNIIFDIVKGGFSKIAGGFSPMGFLKKAGVTVGETEKEGGTGADDVGKKLSKGAKKGTPSGANKAMGTDIKDFLTNLATGIKAFTPITQILKGLVGVAAAGPAFLVFATALPGLLVAMLAGAGGNLIKNGMNAIADGINALSITKIFQGILGIAALGVAFIPFTYALKMLTDVSPAAILASVAAMYALGLGAIALGTVFGSGIGAVLFSAGVAGIAALGLAMIPFGKAAQMAGSGMQNFGAGVKDLAANITGLSSLKEHLEVFKDETIVDGINKMADAIGKLNAELITLRDVTALLSALGGGTTTGGGGNSMADKLDELINLMKNGAIAVNIDGSKASTLLARAQNERGAYGAI